MNSRDAPVVEVHGGERGSGDGESSNTDDGDGDDSEAELANLKL